MAALAIMTDVTGWHTRQLQAALRARGCIGRCVDLAECRIDTTTAWHGLVIPGFGRELPDAVLVRGIAGGTFEQVTKRLGVLHALRELGVPVYNDARAIERSVDKSMTSLLLHAARIPTPPTWVTESQAQAQRIVMGVPNPPARTAGQHSEAGMPEPPAAAAVRPTEAADARQCIVNAWRELIALAIPADQDQRARLERWLQKALDSLPSAPAPHIATFWLGADG